MVEWLNFFLLDLIRKLFNDTQLYEYYVLLNGSARRRNFLSVRSKKKKLKRGPSLKENSGLNRVPGYATFGIVKVDYPGPWVFYLALSIIALPQKLKAFFKGNRQTQALQPGAASPLIETGGHFWGFAGLS